MESSSQRVLLCLMSFLCLISSSLCYDFYVGGSNGWVVNPVEKYSHWARRNRFQVGDNIVFVYGKGDDSVLVVNEEDYVKCSVLKPLKKFDDGDSVFKFDRSGPFYFISGKKESCVKGQKLKVVVMAIREKRNPNVPSPSPVGHNPTPSPSPKAHSPSGSPVPQAHPPKGHSPSASPVPQVQPPKASSPSPIAPTPKAQPPHGHKPIAPSPLAWSPLSPPSHAPKSPSPHAHSPKAHTPSPSSAPKAHAPAPDSSSPVPSTTSLPPAPTSGDAPADPEVFTPAPAPAPKASSSTTITMSFVLASGVSLLAAVILGSF